MSDLSSKLNLSKILEQLEKPDTEEAIYAKIIEFENLYSDHGVPIIEKLRFLRQSLGKKEHARLRKMVLQKGLMKYLRAWAGNILGLLGSMKDLVILENVFKQETESALIQEWILDGLWYNENIDDFNKSSFLLRVIEELVTRYFYSPAPIMDQHYEGLAICIDKACADLAELSHTWKSSQYPPESMQPLINVLKEVVSSPLYEDNSLIGQAIGSIALILNNVGLSEEFSNWLNKRLQKNQPPRFWANLAGKFGNIETCRILLTFLRGFARRVNEETILESLNQIGIRYAGSPEFEKIDFHPLLDKILECTSTIITEKIQGNTSASYLPYYEMNRLKFLRTLETVQGLGKTAKDVALNAVSNEDTNKREQFLDIISDVQDKNVAFDELKKKFFEGTEEERQRAKAALGKMNMDEAVKFLVAQSGRELYKKYVAEPLRELEDMSKAMLARITESVEKGYKDINFMGKVVFYTGIGIIVIGVIIALLGRNDTTQLIFGGTSIGAGILTALINFAKGPVKIVQKAMGDLAQIQTAFLSNITRIHLASFVFLREYAEKKTEPDLAVFESASTEIRDSAADTMILIEFYSGEGEIGKKLTDEQKKELLKTLCDRAYMAKRAKQALLDEELLKLEASNERKSKEERKREETERLKLVEDTRTKLVEELSEEQEAEIKKFEKETRERLEAEMEEKLKAKILEIKKQENPKRTD